MKKKILRTGDTINKGGRIRDGELVRYMHNTGYWSPLQHSDDRSRGLASVEGAFARTRDDLARPARPDRDGRGSDG